MRKSKVPFIMYLIAVMLVACVPGVALADGVPTFTLSTGTETVVPDQELEISFTGSNLKELYAYEALISYDPDVVELEKADSKLEGFFVPPKADNGKITLAFTMVGQKAGEQGSKVLSTISFKGKKQGESNIKLISVKALKPDLTATLVRYGSTFADLEGYEWARNEIEELASSGIIKGTSATTFSPGNNISRADFISLLVRALHLHADMDENFDDVTQSDYYYQEVGIAKKLGIAQGVDLYQFEPRVSISRQDMMVVAARAMKVAGTQLDDAATDLSGFHDSGEVAAYAVTPLAQLVKKGIIQGDNGRIKPNDTATRAEAAVIIYRIIQ
ncbi:S-layer homology domain-containing protein [Paenibacillus ferrarius]|uniref:S-layer homology domain-containing protein n=1 Tax=Paenibacillus ferrarius TaxID=1469647 RepID=UPI003D283F0F